MRKRKYNHEERMKSDRFRNGTLPNGTAMLHEFLAPLPRRESAGLLPHNGEKVIGVYLLVEKSTGILVYVGQGNVNDRLQAHRKDASKPAFDAYFFSTETDAPTWSKYHAVDLEARLLAVYVKAFSAKPRCNRKEEYRSPAVTVWLNHLNAEEPEVQATVYPAPSPAPVRVVPARVAPVQASVVTSRPRYTMRDAQANAPVARHMPEPAYSSGDFANLVAWAVGMTILMLVFVAVIRA